MLLKHLKYLTELAEWQLLPKYLFACLKFGKSIKILFSQSIHWLTNSNITAEWVLALWLMEMIAGDKNWELFHWIICQNPFIVNTLGLRFEKFLWHDIYRQWVIVADKFFVAMLLFLPDISASSYLFSFSLNRSKSLWCEKTDKLCQSVTF